MAMNWTTSPGGLFNRIGAWCKLIKDVRTFQNTTTLTTREPVITDLYHTPATPVRNLKYLTANPPVLFANSKAQMDAITFMALANIRKTILEQVNDEDPLPVKNDDYALDKLIELMKTDSQSVETSLVSATVFEANPNALNRGNPAVHRGVTGTEGITSKNALIRNREYQREEDLEFACVAESTGSGLLSVAGEALQPHASYLWPGGSGPGPNLTIVDTSLDGSGEISIPGDQCLTNRDMESFTANLPDSWTAQTGVAGTDFAQTTVAGEFYRGVSGLKFIGTAASIATQLRQSFADPLGKPKNRTYFMVGFWIKGSSDIPGTGGSFRVAVNIAGMTGTPAVLDLSLSGASFPTAWAHYAFLVSNDAVSVADTDYVSIGLTAGADLTNGQFIYIDDVVLTTCTYHAASLLAAFPGATDARIGDRWTLGLTNTYGAEFQFYLDMAYDLLGRRIGIPSAGSPTIADSLIV